MPGWLLCGLLATGAAPPPQRVSFDASIHPILRAKCQMCHQPASAGGGLVLTSFQTLMKGGEHGSVVAAGKSASSPIMDYLTGKLTLMPKGGPALPDSDIRLFRDWIDQGAVDDTPAAHDAIDATHPPVYTAAPIISALAWSPDSKLIAVSGYREVLLARADGSGLAGRLVGDAQRILSVAWSPDGRLLAASGGTPALFGEVQFWDTSTWKLDHAARDMYDTLFGGSWSPDGREYAFGCSDNSVRAITVPAGAEVLKFDNHSDWVLATTFSKDGKHVLSTGRDQAIKLILLDGPTGSFIDDINTHTCAMRCLVRRPGEDQVLCGGDDGVPRLYKVFRTEARTMNQEDHDLIRAYERQPATITSAAFRPDGKAFATGSEAGLVNVYDTDTGAHLASLSGERGVVYAVAWSPDGTRIAVGGSDGVLRVYDTQGKLLVHFIPAPLTQPAKASAAHRERGR